MDPGHGECQQSSGHPSYLHSFTVYGLPKVLSHGIHFYYTATDSNKSFNRPELTTLNHQRSFLGNLSILHMHAYWAGHTFVKGSSTCTQGIVVCDHVALQGLNMIIIYTYVHEGSCIKLCTECLEHH